MISTVSPQGRGEKGRYKTGALLIYLVLIGYQSFNTDNVTNNNIFQ